MDGLSYYVQRSSFQQGEMPPNTYPAAECHERVKIPTYKLPSLDVYPLYVHPLVPFFDGFLLNTLAPSLLWCVEI